MTVFILMWIFYCILEGYDHAWYTSINHSRAALRRIAQGIVVTYAVAGADGPVVLYLNTALLLASLFTTFFDISRNLATGQPWHYIGTTSDIDKLINKHKRLAWTLKFSLCVLAIIVHLYTARYAVCIHPLINLSCPS